LYGLSVRPDPDRSHSRPGLHYINQLLYFSSIELT
jgi:hypothetical protein